MSRFTFEQYEESSRPYFEAVSEAGDLAWFEDQARAARVAERLGLPPTTPTAELRRALWERRHSR